MDSSPIRLMSASEQNSACDKPNVASDKPADKSVCHTSSISTPEPSPKRRKISAEEKEKMRLEKELVKKQKEEERELIRKQKEEEKRQREEEKEQLKKQKEEEKEQLRKQKEEEKRRKEEEKKRVAEEKEAEKAKIAEEKEAKRLEKEAELKKKEQEQTRIMSFFNKKTKKKSKKVEVDSEQTLDFDKDFLPFHIKDSVTMADTCSESHDLIDQDPVDWLSSLNISGNEVKEEVSPVPAKTIITHIQTAATLGLNPDVYNGTPSDTLVNALPRRYLQFYGDERPAYLGTYSKTCSTDLFQNPLFQVPGLDYEYDSEADWEDEGEDVEDDEMSGDEEMDDDEMADFVCSDDAKSPSTVTAKVPTAQEPVIVWGCTDMVGMAFGGLIADGGIDPFKDYWTVKKPVEVPPVPCSIGSSTSPSTASSSKPDLSPFAVLSKTLSSSPAVASAVKQNLAAAKPQKLIDGDDLKALLQRVNGSDDNKTLLTELLCKQYPQYTRKMVTATIQHYAERQGSKSDKRWVLKNV